MEHAARPRRHDGRKADRPLHKASLKTLGPKSKTEERSAATMTAEEGPL